MLKTKSQKVILQPRTAPEPQLPRLPHLILLLKRIQHPHIRRRPEHLIVRLLPIDQLQPEKVDLLNRLLQLLSQLLHLILKPLYHYQIFGLGGPILKNLL